MNKVLDPNEFLRQQIRLKQNRQQAVCFDYEQSYLPGNPIVKLGLVLEFCTEQEGGIHFLVSDQITALEAQLEKGLSGKEIAKALTVAWLELDKGLKLEPVKIPKPWGQEIWYTGIEERGVSQLVSEEGCSPLSWVLAALSEQILLEHKMPVLLKILDPLPNEVLGDLYFEMHEEKQEVYVVTSVDENAWPNGEGAIRFGFNQDVRASYTSDEAFKQAYLKSVKNYQSIRNELDSLNKNDIALQEKEKTLRTEMEQFSELRRLQVGDVINVPCFTPHSLQHGVRTVEFQTPVYERKILSFGQKVLTQNHWDTEVALELVNLELPEVELPKMLLDKEGVRIENIVSFDDFTVQRITLAEGASLNVAESSYQLVFVVKGEVELLTNILHAEECLLLPAITSCTDIRAIKGEAIVLKALPVAS